MAVPVYSLDLYVAKVANGPGRRIFFLVAFVFRVIFSKNPFSGNAKLCRHICRCDIRIAVKGAGPVCIPGHQLMEYVSGQAFGDVAILLTLRKIVSKV